MGRNIGPVFKKSRRYGFSILETGKEFAKGKQRNTPPGEHGGARRRKLSDFGIHLYEKQKMKFMYFVNEKQMKKAYNAAQKSKDVTGTAMLQFLESRLDNIVYRAGYAQTRKQARQLVSHNHFLLNSKKANIPSMLVKIDDVIELKTKSQNNAQIKEALTNRPTASWMTREGFKTKLDRWPERSELNKEINEALIVEYYSK